MKPIPKSQESHLQFVFQKGTFAVRSLNVSKRKIAVNASFLCVDVAHCMRHLVVGNATEHNVMKFMI